MSMHRNARRPLLAAIVLAAIAGTAPAQALVAEGDLLPPGEQRQRFHLPPGFEIQLVVSEPDIGQPMNLNFDARGRLWVTSSIEYPYPADGPGVEPREERWGKPANHPPGDWLTVIEGIDASGRPARVTRFAEGLNIPIGVLPDGDGAIVYSIPNIDRIRDTDGDGQAEERTKLYGPFGNLDTHGNVASLSFGLDGWVYATHGFRNTSQISGSDGNQVSMNSGNTFRFRPDGSRVEHWTHGQVNPFGLCFDPWGNLYSADCHTMPLTCLLRGAYYDSFGKPHDGLGYGPQMIDHLHGSTGICGCAWYDATEFPEQYRNCIFLCNPVTGRVHHDRIEWRGSSPWVQSQPDFITCEDQWFRPVDVKLGPDGALYIADFYNAVIGHYEVPLEHPKRDRTHGRVWRVVYRGERGSVPANGTACPADFNLTDDSLPELMASLGSDNMTIRCLATREVLDRFGAEEVRRVIADHLLTPLDGGNDRFLVHALWLIARTGGIDGALAAHLQASSSPVVLTHLLRAASEGLVNGGRLPVPQGPAAEHPMVRRALAEAVSVRGLEGVPEGQEIFDALVVAATSTGHDTHLRHVARMALRNQLSSPESAATILTHARQSPGDWLPIALGSRTPAGASILLAMLPDLVGEHRLQAVEHIAKSGNDSQAEELVLVLSRDRSGDDWRAELADIRAYYSGTQGRAGDLSALCRDWGNRLAERLLNRPLDDQIGWTAVAYGPNASSESAWGTQPRPFADGPAGELLHSSFPPGETRTGILRSDAFALPDRLRFFVAGHNGFPEHPETPNNLVRLKDAETDAVLREALPPREDTAQPVDWDLSEFAGRRGYVELVDGDPGTAYAWLAAGRFSVAGLNPAAESAPREGCRLIAMLKLTDHEPRLRALANAAAAPASLRSAAAEALLTLRPDARAAVLLAAAGSGRLPESLRETCYGVISSDDRGALIDGVLKQVVQAATADEQSQLAAVLVSDAAGASSLLQLIEQGAASPRLLQNASLVERLKSWPIDAIDERLNRLTADLPSLDEALANLLNSRRELYRSQEAVVDAAAGAAVFKKQCAACHQLGGEGNRIGPQLEGIGLRGADRLLEDILDPNRNVDAAFRSTAIVLESGQLVTGLVRREDAETLVLADQQGKEFTVLVGEIEARRHSALSLMPEKLGESIPEAELLALVKFLASHTTPPATTEEPAAP